MSANVSAPLVRNGSQTVEAPGARRKRVLIFSPDADLARCLLLILEDRFEIVRKTRLEDFEHSIHEVAPDLVLIDLFTYSADIVKQLDVVRRNSLNVPVLVLRAYRSLSPSMNTAIEEVASLVFYKPVDVDLVTQAIEDMLK